MKKRKIDYGKLTSKIDVYPTLGFDVYPQPFHVQVVRLAIGLSTSYILATLPRNRIVQDYFGIRML